MSQPFPPKALRRRHAQTVRDRCSSYRIDYVIVIKNFLNPDGHQNPITSSKVTAILLKRWILPYGGASAREGLRLQPVQQACFIYYRVLTRPRAKETSIQVDVDVLRDYSVKTTSRNIEVNSSVCQINLFGETLLKLVPWIGKQS